MINITKSVCVIIGTIIGAGFASGREIYTFFNVYGSIGVIGILIASIISGIVIYKVLKYIRNKKIENYNQYLEELVNSKKTRDVFNIIINIFLLISFYIMIAGFCAYFKQEFNISPYIIGLIMAILCYFTFINRIEGVTKINTILIPMLIGVIILIGIRNGLSISGELEDKMMVQQTKFGIGWLISSIEYACYNSILLIPILISLKKYSKNKEGIISIISASVFLILSIVLYLVLLSGGKEIINVDLPLIYIVNKFGSIYRYLCGIVVVSAIFTTAISAGYGFLQNVSKDKATYKIIAIIICSTSILAIKLGFSYLVDLTYPIFGLLSFIQIIYILKK